jgi:hypothetical protein
MRSFVYQEGKLFDLHGQDDIKYVFEQAELFGLTQKEIQDEYDKFGSKLGDPDDVPPFLEPCEARDKIMRRVTKKGWIFIRSEDPQGKEWSIEVYRDHEDDFRDLMEKFREEQIVPLDAEVNLLVYYKTTEKYYTYRKFSDYFN